MARVFSLPFGRLRSTFFRFLVLKRGFRSTLLPPPRRLEAGSCGVEATLPPSSCFYLLSKYHVPFSGTFPFRSTATHWTLFFPFHPQWGDLAPMYKLGDLIVFSLFLGVSCSFSFPGLARFALVHAFPSLSGLETRRQRSSFSNEILSPRAASLSFPLPLQSRRRFCRRHRGAFAWVPSFTSVWCPWQQPVSSNDRGAISLFCSLFFFWIRPLSHSSHRMTALKASTPPLFRPQRGPGGSVKPRFASPQSRSAAYIWFFSDSRSVPIKITGPFSFVFSSFPFFVSVLGSSWPPFFSPLRSVVWRFIRLAIMGNVLDFSPNFRAVLLPPARGSLCENFFF